MPAGRPTKYDPSICADVPALFANGESKAEVAVALGVTRQTLHNWAKAHPEFFDAMAWGETLAEAWWLRLGRLNL